MAFIAAIPVAYFAAAAAVAGVATAVVSANNASNQAKGQKDAAKYNALVGKQQSDAALQAANAREDQQRRVARFASGERQAAIAQSGTGLGGSNADVDRQSEILAELDALNIRYEGQTNSTGLLNQSTLDSGQADAYGKAARSAQTQGYIGAASAALSGYGGVQKAKASQVKVA